jgi:putative DNA primase/helicase
VDLKTGALRPSDRADGITKLTAVAPAAKADCPLWLEFLRQATNGDAELVRFLRHWCGYCLTGDISEHALLFIYGPGGNGKGVFLNTVAKIFDAYHKTAPMETFTASNSDRHPTDLAGLSGARLVAVSETEEGKAWAESKIKSITGGDRVSARFMRQDFFEYEPQFKLTIVGNHKPRLRNVDDAARRRFNIVPFVHKPAKVDPYLVDKLKKEWPAILRWMIDGCLDWQRNGLVRPKVVTDATAEYFEDQDSFTQWLEECCDVEIGNRYKTATSDELFASWSAYARAAAVDAGTKIGFGEKLRGAHLEPYKNNGQRGWRFVQVKRPRTYGQKDDE